MTKTNLQTCECCFGTGTRTDNLKLGRSLSGQRLRSNIGLREMARRLGISHPFLSQMEKGERKWSSENRHNYLKECQCS